MTTRTITTTMALASRHVRTAVISTFSLAALALPGVASAAQRFAGPAGTGTACTQAAPCSLGESTNNAGTGDEVIVLPGDYGSAAAPVAGAPGSVAAVTVHGQDGAPRPRVFLGTFPLDLASPAALVRDLELVQSTGYSGALLYLRGGTAERVLVGEVPSSGACFLFGNATLSDSVCPGIQISTAASATVTLRNVTAISRSGGTALFTTVGAGATLTVNATNVIVRSNGPADVVASASPGGTAVVNLDHSSFATRSAPGQGGGTTSITDPATNANQTAMPLLVSATDLHQLRGSPTIDAGAAAPMGALDFDRDPRTLGAAPDIGADEFVDRTPVVTTGAAGAVDVTGATLNGSVDPRGLETTARFEYGTTTAYGLQTPVQTIGAPLSGGQALSAVLSGLAAGTTYHFRAVAANAAGSPVGTDATFTTAAAAPGTMTPSTGTGTGPPDTTKPVLRAVRLSRKTFRVGPKPTAVSAKAGVGTTVRLSSSEQATVRLGIVREAAGRRSGSRCVKPTAALKGRKSCVRLVAAGALTRASRAGANLVAFSGRVGNRRLAPGRYRFQIRATDAAGNRSAITTLRFRIVRR